MQRRTNGGAAGEKKFFEFFLLGKMRDFAGGRQETMKICENGKIGGPEGLGRNGRRSPMPSAGDSAEWKWAQKALTQTSPGKSVLAGFCRHPGGYGVQNIALDTLTGCGCGGADGCAVLLSGTDHNIVLSPIVLNDGAALGLCCHGITSKMA